MIETSQTTNTVRELLQKAATVLETGIAADRQEEYLEYLRMAAILELIKTQPPETRMQIIRKLAKGIDSNFGAYFLSLFQQREINYTYYSVLLNTFWQFLSACQIDDISNIRKSQLQLLLDQLRDKMV